MQRDLLFYTRSGLTKQELSTVSVKGQYVGLARGYNGAKILVNERKQLLELGLGTKPAVH